MDAMIFGNQFIRGARRSAATRKDSVAISPAAQSPKGGGVAALSGLQNKALMGFFPGSAATSRRK
jgi:hypothetical protein